MINQEILVLTNKDLLDKKYKINKEDVEGIHNWFELFNECNSIVMNSEPNWNEIIYLLYELNYIKKIMQNWSKIPYFAITKIDNVIYKILFLIDRLAINLSLYKLIEYDDHNNIKNILANKITNYLKDRSDTLYEEIMPIDGFYQDLNELILSDINNHSFIQKIYNDELKFKNSSIDMWDELQTKFMKDVSVFNTTIDPNQVIQKLLLILEQKQAIYAYDILYYLKDNCQNELAKMINYCYLINFLEDCQNRKLTVADWQKEYALKHNM